MEIRNDTKQPVKVAICIPSTGMWHADFGVSMMQMCVYVSGHYFEHGQERSCIVLEKRTSVLPQSRQEALEDALTAECTHALFVDSDQSFPADTLHRLMAHKVKCVGANIAVKTTPSFPTARMRGPTSFGIPLASHGRTGIEKVWRLGMGVMLIDLSAVKGIRKPWFEIPYSVKNAQFVGEDWYFCGLLEKAGVDIYVDHDLSHQVGHVGQFKFTHVNIPELPADMVAA